MTKLDDKLDKRMDQLQWWMESDYHLKNPEEVCDFINDKLNFAWTILSDDDKEYIHYAQYAIEKQIGYIV